MTDGISHTNLRERTKLQHYTFPKLRCQNRFFSIYRKVPNVLRKVRSRPTSVRPFVRPITFMRDWGGGREGEEEGEGKGREEEREGEGREAVSGFTRPFSRIVNTKL